MRNATFYPLFTLKLVKANEGCNFNIKHILNTKVNYARQRIRNEMGYTILDELKHRVGRKIVNSFYLLKDQK